MAGMYLTLLCVLVTFVVLPTASASGVEQNPSQANAGPRTSELTSREEGVDYKYNGVRASSSVLAFPCTENRQCEIRASSCFKGQCLCSTGYYYSGGSNRCLKDCLPEDLGEVFIKYQGSKLIGTPLWGGHLTLSECKERCVSDTACRYINHNTRSYCELHADTARNGFYGLNYDGTDHYQRMCV